MAKQTKRSQLGSINFSIPVEERIRYYFILGFRATEIYQFLRNEFRELELTEYSRYNLKQYIDRHQQELSAAQHEFRMELRQVINDRLRSNFSDAHLMELDAVRVYIKKAKDIVGAIEDLDILKRDEEGNFVNRGQFITLMMIFKEQQAMVGKLAQTDAAREYALYVRKMAIKAQEAKDSGMCEEAEVSFLDADNDFFPNDKKRLGLSSPTKSHNSKARIEEQEKELGYVPFKSRLKTTDLKPDL